MLRVAIISIILESKENVDELNKIIRQYSQYIIGRMGLPYPKRNISIISLVIDAPEDEINSLSGKIGKLKGISSKVVYSKSLLDK